MKRQVIDDRRGYSLLEIMMVVAIFGILAAISLPQMSRMFGFYKLSGDARSISNSLAGVKMRAAREFSQVRLYVDLNSRTYWMEVWDKTAQKWTVQGGVISLSSTVKFDYNPVTQSPKDTQPGQAIQQPAKCTNDPAAGKTAPLTGPDIDGTACVVFNSRGVPIDKNGPTAWDAVYVTDGTAVYAITVAATGMIRSWQTPPIATPTWALN